MSMEASDIQMSAGLDADFLRSLFQGAPAALMVCTPDGMLLGINSAALRILGLSRAPALPALARSLVAEPDWTCFESALTACVANVESTRASVSAAGPPVTTRLNLRLAPVVLPDGSIHGVSILIEEPIGTEGDIRSFNKQVRLNSLASLAGAVAHHYNNLLCSIATTIEFANSMTTVAAVRRALSRLDDPLQRGATISQQLLAFAQADHRSRDQSDLTESILQFCDENEERLAKLHIRLNLVPGKIPVLAVPRRSVDIILRNLADNAIDAMRSGGTLTVELGPLPSGGARLVVSDTGPGIAPEVMDRIFEPFITTKGELSLHGGMARNAGLGLAVAHGLMQSLGGTISAANSTTGGARFELTFPPNQG